MIRAVVALLLALAGCTAQPGPDNGIASARGAGAAPSGSPTQGAAGYDGVKLAQCLRDQGIPAEDPGPGQEKPQLPESVDSTRLEAAMQNCKQFAPDYGKPVPPPDQVLLENLRKFAQCMRDEGVDWPDPDPRTGRPLESGEPDNPNRDPNQPPPSSGAEIEAAMKVCAEKVPGAGITVDESNGPKGSGPR